MKWFDKKHPWWLPAGSLRWLFVFALLGIVSGFSWAGIDVPEELMTLLGAAGGYVIGNRNGQGGS